MLCVLKIANCRLPRVQVELFEGHGKHVDALDTYQDLCIHADSLVPPPRGVSAGLTGRLAANHALSYLSRIPDDSGSATALICRSLELWLLKVCSSSWCWWC